MRGKDPGQEKRPVNLDLRTFHFPSHAIASILHRIAGIVLFLFIPLLLWMLQSSLSSYEQFLLLQDQLTSPLFKVLVWGLLTAFIYHLLAGIRHLTMDVGIGESLSAGRWTAKLVIALAIVLSLGIGVWLWS